MGEKLPLVGRVKEPESFCMYTKDTDHALSDTSSFTPGSPVYAIDTKDSSRNTLLGIVNLRYSGPPWHDAMYSLACIVAQRPDGILAPTSKTVSWGPLTADTWILGPASSGKIMSAV